MDLHIDREKDTEVKVTISANVEELALIKNKVLHKLAHKVKVTGFREGKAPVEMVEKNIDQQLLQTEFIDEAINSMYVSAIKEERLRPVAQPKVEIKKFVPFTVFEVEIEVPVIGKIKLANFKQISAKRAKLTVTKKEIDEVLQNLRNRASTKKEVTRAVKKTDEVIIDFSGVDSKDKEVPGATGKDYALIIGSKSFIPGFEENIIGLKTGGKKDFDVKFPDDYGVPALRKAKVKFSVTVKKVNEVVEPKMDEDFIKKVGPFKTLKELTDDIEKQLKHEQSHRIERDYEAAIVEEISKKSKVTIPDSLIKEQEKTVLQEVRQNIVQRGMTFEEYLKSINLTEEKFMEKEVKPESEKRVKAGLVLSEIADIEGISVSDEELTARIDELKKQYTDDKMRSELDKSENRHEIAGRLRTEKVLQYLKSV